MARRQRTKQTPAIQSWLNDMQRADTMLRAVRQARGLMQYQAAEEFGVTESSWSRYETRAKRPPHGLLQQVAREWNAPAVLLDNEDASALAQAVVSDGNVVSLEAWLQRREPRARVVWAIEDADGTLHRMAIEAPRAGDGNRPGPKAGAGRVIPFRRAA